MKESTTPASLQIGHNGLTPSVVKEIQEQVRTKKVVKAKRLRSTPTEGTEKEFWQAAADRAGVRLLEVRGHSAVFCDPGYRTERERTRNRGPPPIKRPLDD